MAARDKLVDKWIYKYKGQSEGETRVSDKIAEIEVRLVKESADSDEAPYPLKSVKFEVSCNDPVFRIRGTDIEAIRRAIWAELDAHFKIRWESWFLVKVDSDRPYAGIGTGLIFSYESVERGTAHDGTLLLREIRTRRAGDPWTISPWPGEFKDSRGNVMACIPATDENRRALEQFSASVDMLRQRIAGYLRPENIVETLANLSFVGLALAGPSQEGDR